MSAQSNIQHRLSSVIVRPIETPSVPARCKSREEKKPSVKWETISNFRL